MAIKKTELYSSLWASCDELRGGMDASQYKDYILTLLFIKYVSDKHIKKTGMIVVPKGCTFPDMVKLKGNKEIGEKINIILESIGKENNLTWLANKDNNFNDEERLGKGKEMVDRLSRLIGIFEGLEFGGNNAQGDDLLGDAYEYLMRNFATESGKSKGQFYTPAEVSRILAKVIGITEETLQDQTVYDPTCGSGSLLLKAANEAKNGLSIYGQEKDVATTALCRMNMILHNNADAEIAPGGHSTLAEPEFKKDNSALKTFDFAVANPPFSFKAWSTGFKPKEDEYKRFEYGVPPEKNGDYAFLLHILASLKSTGKGAVILPHGVLFRGNAEAEIRRNLIKQGIIKGIIGLPANLFYGTGIPACIIVIDKDGAKERLNNENSGIFMIDASKGFKKDGPKNRLREQDIHKIVDIFNNQITETGYSRMVGFEEIEKNEFNLNIPRYIDSSEKEDLHDLSAHLSGGIPKRDVEALQKYWEVFPDLRKILFADERDGYCSTLVKASEVKNTILEHSKFKDFADTSLQLFNDWCEKEDLKSLKKGDIPKEVIRKISESLLHTYKKVPLLDPYDMYQILMDYWSEVMQDDHYVITQDGWEAGNILRELVVEKGKKLKETPDLILGKKKYKAELIPPALIINRFFNKEQNEIDNLQSVADTSTQELQSYIEEHAVEEGFLEEALTDSGSVTKKSVMDRLKSATDKEEISTLKKVKKLIEKEAKDKKEVKDASELLNQNVFEKYPKLNSDECKDLIADDKWITTLKSNINGEIERITQQLANRIKTLDERYTEPLPKLLEEVDKLSSAVEEHLKKMGLSW